MPPEIIVTNLKPYITIWEKENNKFHIFELTEPLDVNISQRTRQTNVLNPELCGQPFIFHITLHILSQL